MKKSKIFLIYLCVFIITGCAYVSPIYLSKSSRKLYKDTIGHEVPNYKGITATGVLKGVDEELDFRKQEYLLKWTFTKKLNTGYIVLGNTISNSFLGLLALTGPVGMGIAHKLGKDTKRDGDFTPEEVEKIKTEYGLKDPEKVKQELGLT